MPPGLVVPPCSLLTPLLPSQLQAQQHQLSQSPWVAEDIPSGFVPLCVASPGSLGGRRGEDSMQLGQAAFPQCRLSPVWGCVTAMKGRHTGALLPYTPHQDYLVQQTGLCLAFLLSHLCKHVVWVQKNTKYVYVQFLFYLAVAVTAVIKVHI